jgi:cob(I)alamin adenosyltransferase
MNLKENPLVTDLVGAKTTKLDSRVIFFGTCDELSCHIMNVRTMIDDDFLKEQLEIIVKTLSLIMGEVAGSKNKLTMEHLEMVLGLIDKYKYSFNGFILPGQTSIACAIHITRCVARRTELAYAKVYSEHQTSDIIFEYLNKLSTLFYNIAQKYEK